MDEENNDELTLSESNDDIKEAKKKGKQFKKNKPRRYKEKTKGTIRNIRKARQKYNDGKNKAISQINKRNNPNNNNNNNNNNNSKSKGKNGVEKTGYATEKVGNTTKNTGKALKATGKTMKASGEAMKASGEAMKASGKAMQAGGKAVQAGGEAIKQGSKGLGEALAYTGVGAPVGAVITGAGTAAGEGTKAAGKGVEVAGKATEKAGEATKKAGEATKKAGEATEKAGEATEKAGNAIKEGGKRIRKAGEKANKFGPKGINEKKKKEFIKKFAIAHIPQIAIAILILLFVLFLIGLVMFFVNMPGLILGSFEEFGRNVLGNIQGLLTGDSTTARVSNEDIVDLAQHIQAMGYDIQGYGLGNVEYEKDGSTPSSRNGKSKEIKAIKESVDGKQYLRSYIATNENTYVLSEWSIGGFFQSLGNNIIKGIDNIIDITPDNIKETNAEDYSTGMINIVGKTDSSIFESSDAKDYVSIDRNTKQMKIYSDAFKLPELIPGVGKIGIGKRLITGDSKIQFGETYSYDLNNWVGRYGRPTELFLALHLSTLMPDLTYEIATNQAFNTKVDIGMLDASVQFAPTATKGDSTIDSLQIMRYFLQYCVGRDDVESLNDEDLKTEFRKTTEDIIANAIANMKAGDDKIGDTEWTTAEIVELAAITHTGMNSSSSSSSSSSTNPSFTAVGEDNGNFTKYKLNDYQLSQMTFVAYREQGSDAGAAAEASLMANLFELRRGGEGGADGLVDYVLHGGWFASSSTGNTDDDPAHKEIVKQVLVNGKRTMPAYIDEHDCFSDIPSATNNGNPINVSDRSAYVKDTTIINNCYGSTYTFYSFPEENSDPFGYHEKFGSDFHYVYDPSSEPTSSGTGTNSSSSGNSNSGSVPILTGVNIGKNEFVKKCEEYQNSIGGNRDFAQNAGVVYDVCVKSNINPVICAAEGMVEQGWISPNIAKNNFWGLGIWDTGENHFGSRSIEDYVQLWCDSLNAYISGEANTNFSKEKAESYHSYGTEVSKEYQASDPNHYTGGMNTIYDIFGAYNGFGNPQQSVDYVEAPDYSIYKFAKDIFGADILEGEYQNNGGGNGINIKWPYIANVKNHWYYDDIDFTKGVYRFAKAATKTMDYIPDDEDNVLNKNKVSVKLDSTITSDMGVMYQVAEPEAKGPNNKIIEIFNGEYYKYDGNIDRAKKIEMKKAQDLNKFTFDFNGETYTVNSEDTKDIKKQKVSFKENKPEALTAFGILENMHTEASDYIYRNLKELMVSLKHFTTAELTEDLENMLLWPIKTEIKDKQWEKTIDPNKFGTTIKCGVEENIVLAPSDAVVKEINGNSVTLKLTTLNEEATELLEYIYKHKDSFKKINRDLLTGYELTIDDIKLSNEIKQGSEIKRGQEIGTAEGESDGKKSITITLYQLDKSVVENISTYLRQEENNKYEEIMRIKKDAKLEYKEGIDIEPVINGSVGPSSGGGQAPAGTAKNVKEFVEKALSVEGAGYSPTGYNWTGDIATSVFTCSGLVDFALGNPPRTNWPESFYASVSERGKLVMDPNQLKYGDLVFYEYAGRYPGHVAIYIGNGEEIEADGSLVTKHPVGWMPFIGGGTYLE